MVLGNTGLKAQQETRLSTIRLNDQSQTISVKPISYSDPGNNKDYDYYMKKSRNNKIASWCLVGGGFVIAGIGALTFPKYYDPVWGGNDSETENKADVSTTLIVVGIAAMLSSIPCTIMASVNKRKAKLMVSSQKTGQRLPPGIGNTVTGMTISIPIGK